MSLALPVDGTIEWAASLSLTLETPTSSAASQAKSESTAAQPTEFKVDAEGEALPKRVLRMPGDSAMTPVWHFRSCTQKYVSESRASFLATGLPFGLMQACIYLR